MTPKYWGPSVWGFLHTLAAKISDEGYIQLRTEIYNMVYKILVLLPCPECSHDATAHFKTVPAHFLRDRTTFCNAIYLLHNKINVKLKKPLFNASHLSVYSHSNIINAYNNFTRVFNTTASRLMNENLHRRMFVGNLHKWLMTNIRFFITYKPVITREVPTIHTIHTVPIIPTIPTIPTVPIIPTIPTIPTIHTVPIIPTIHTIPTVPIIPTIPTVHTIHTVPIIPTIPTIPNTPGVVDTTVLIEDVPHITREQSPTYEPIEDGDGLEVRAPITDIGIPTVAEMLDEPDTNDIPTVAEMLDEPDTNNIPSPIDAHILEPSVNIEIIEQIDNIETTFGTIVDVAIEDTVTAPLPKKRGRKKKV
jgi:hypothetical protein